MSDWNKFSGVSAWLRSCPGVENDIVYRDLELADRFERSGGVEKNRQNFEREKRANNLLYGIGKGVVSGYVYDCGDILEIYVSEEPLYQGACVEGLKAVSEKKEEESQESIAKRVNHRARKNIRRIVNAADLKMMHTLTLAPPSEANDKMYETVPYELQKDYEFVRNLFKNGMKRANRYLQDEKIHYLAVFELHDSPRTSEEKRGAWHIHIATQANERIAMAFSHSWKHGQVNTQDYRYNLQGERRKEEIHNPGAYMAEYIGKEGAQFGKKELINKRRYTTSRGLKRPDKKSLDVAGLVGDFENLEYGGSTWKNNYYKARHVPGTDRFSVNAIFYRRKET